MSAIWRCARVLGLLAMGCVAEQQHALVLKDRCSMLGPAEKNTYRVDNVTNQCVTFNVGSGTGCAWMCEYCANALGTNNYYFTDGVCSYHYPEGCTGSPIAGVEYTCCSASQMHRD